MPIRQRVVYKQVHAPQHPRACLGANRDYVLEHVLIAERALGRALSSRHPVHHVNGDGRDNTPTNLVLCEDRAYHMLLHRRQRAFDACGHADWRRCQHCGEWGDPATLRIYGRNVHHAECRRAYERRRRHNR